MRGREGLTTIHLIKVGSEERDQNHQAANWRNMMPARGCESSESEGQSNVSHEL